MASAAKGRRNENHRRVGAGLFHRLLPPCRTPADPGASCRLCRHYAAHHVRAVGDGLLCVEGAFLAVNPCTISRVFRSTSTLIYAAGLTTFCAASRHIQPHREVQPRFHQDFAGPSPRWCLPCAPRWAPRCGVRGPPPPPRWPACRSAGCRRRINEHGLDVLVRQQDAERVLDLLGAGPPPTSRSSPAHRPSA